MKSETSIGPLPVPALRTAYPPTARSSAPRIDARALPPCRQEWRSVIVGVLNHALSAEIVHMQRYLHQHFAADDSVAVGMTKKFLDHATVEARQADRLARRISELGGKADFRPPKTLEPGSGARGEPRSLRGLMRADLQSELDAVERYRNMIEFVALKDLATYRLLEEILAEKQQHADELSSWLMH